MQFTNRRTSGVEIEPSFFSDGDPSPAVRPKRCAASRVKGGQNFRDEKDAITSEKGRPEEQVPVTRANGACQTGGHSATGFSTRGRRRGFGAIIAEVAKQRNGGRTRRWFSSRY